MIGVIGGGAFGTALATVLASDGSDVRLWMRNAETARAVNTTHENAKKLPGIKLQPSVVATPSLADLDEVDVNLLVLPAQQTKAFLAGNDARLSRAPIVLCAKGIATDTLELQSQMTSNPCVSVLSGPGFAGEIAQGLPTALTLASEHERLAELQARLSRPHLRLYRTVDVVGAQLGGALKNVIAIAAGISIGAGLGESARAAIMTRGFAEMRALAAKMGADDNTLAGLSGLGDLSLTCASAKSRNFAHGLALGQNKPGAKQTVEGIATARAAQRLAARHGVEMPIADAVADVLEGSLTISQAMQRLLARPLRAE